MLRDPLPSFMSGIERMLIADKIAGLDIGQVTPDAESLSAAS